MDEQESNNPLISIHVPVALVALALCVLFFSQIMGVKTGTETMRWQLDNANKQIDTLKDNREKLAKAIEDRKPMVATSEDTQKKFTDLIKDVNELANKGDEDAKKIIVGYGIQISDNKTEKKEK
jgi:peptidoglycan hydrolase CwlO-like protein